MAKEIDLEIFRTCKNIKVWIYIGQEIIEKDIMVIDMDEKKSTISFDPIYVNEKPIRLDSSKNKITIVAYRDNEKPLMFANPVVNTVWIEKEKFFSMLCGRKGSG